MFDSTPQKYRKSVYCPNRLHLELDGLCSHKFCEIPFPCKVPTVSTCPFPIHCPAAPTCAKSPNAIVLSYKATLLFSDWSAGTIWPKREYIPGNRVFLLQVPCAEKQIVFRAQTTIKA